MICFVNSAAAPAMRVMRASMNARAAIVLSAAA
jgi:hypothetical protein